MVIGSPRWWPHYCRVIDLLLANDFEAEKSRASGWGGGII